MSTNHTQGAIKVGQTLKPSPTLESVNGGRFAIALVEHRGPVAWGDARRLAACWNACEGVSTERLEGDWKEGYEPWGHVQHLQAQRDQLLAALQGLIEINSPLAGGPSHGELVEEWESEKRAGNLAAEYHLAALAAVAAAKGGAA